MDLFRFYASQHRANSNEDSANIPSGHCTGPLHHVFVKVQSLDVPDQWFLLVFVFPLYIVLLGVGFAILFPSVVEMFVCLARHSCLDSIDAMQKSILAAGHLN